MKKRVLSLLGLMGLIVIGSFAWHRQHAQSELVVAKTSVATTALPQTVALTQESIDALKADNSELKARVDTLRNQQTDADQLIALKAARLATLEKSAQKP